MNEVSKTRKAPIFGPTPDQPMVDHALHYASHGWHVFPAPIGTKKSHKSAERSEGRKWGMTIDLVEIKRDFKFWHDANIGIATGAVSGIFVVDVDTKAGHDVDGIASMASLEAEHGEIRTRRVISPSGSIHYLFKHPGFPIKNSASEIGPGIDVRGDGGMVLAVPSVVESREATEDKPAKVGGVYRWEDEFAPIADCPQWLLDRIAAGKETEPEPEPELSITQRALAAVQPRDGFDDIADEARSRTGGGYIQAALDGEYEEVVRAPKGKRNPQLNDSAVKLGHYVGGGVLDEQKVVDTLMSACATSGLLADDGRNQCLATIKSGLTKGTTEPKGIPERPDRTADVIPIREGITPKPAQQPVAIHATRYVWKDAATIRRREWLYGGLLLRKFVSTTISPGGVGKSSLVAAEAMAMVSGKNLLGVEPVSPLNVWIWNLEDPLEETERKIQAAAKHYELEPADIDRLWVDSGRDQKLVIAGATRNGFVIYQPVVDSLVEEIIKHKIDVLIIDPFVSCHEVTENDNSAMDAVVKEWARVAQRGNCAVHLVHHTRKPMGAEGEVTTDSSRGASSQTDACWVVRVINRMSEKEATAAGVTNRRLYFRTSNDKDNLNPPVEKADWFKLESVDLGNGDQWGEGDSVGVVTKWELPAALAGLTAADFDKVAAVIRGGKWRQHPAAAAWVGNAIAEALDLDIEDPKDMAKVKRYLGAWIAAKTLIVVERKDENRAVRKFVEVAGDE
jgi:hypothetical protein